jgi:hypothetical protein
VDSLTLKVEALAWLRFTKKMLYVATEAGSWASDILGCDNDISVEVEVKVSASDLRREFSDKAHKHSYYRNSSVSGGSAPNYFYLYVPESLAEVATKLLEKYQPCAGLIVYDDDGEGSKYQDGKKSKVVRKPKKLHQKRPTESLKRQLLLRMGSELVGRYVAWKKFSTQFNDLLQNTSTLISEEVKASLKFNGLEEANDQNPEDPEADGSIP